MSEIKLVQAIEKALKSRGSPAVLVETQSPLTAFTAAVQAATSFAKGYDTVNIYHWDDLGRLLAAAEDRGGGLAWREAPVLEPAALRALSALSSDGANVVVRSYVTDGQAAREVAAVASILLHRPEAYAGACRLVVISSDLSLFPPEVSGLCATVEHRPPDSGGVAHFLSAVGYIPDTRLVESARGLSEDQILAVLSRSKEEKGAADPEFFYEEKRRLLALAGLEVVRPSRGLESIGGYGYLKRYIHSRLIPSIADVDGLRRLGIDADRPRGILLYGLPGTGKTAFAMALAAEVGVPMVRLTPSQLFHGIVGESEKAVRRVVRAVEALAPVIVFIDEADQLMTSRAEVPVGTDSGVARRVTSGLLEWLGSRERQSFVIAATNHARDIDPAFLRPGRIDAVIPVFPPDAKARAEIFRVHTQVVRNVPVVADPAEVAASTELWTGAEIEKLVVSAAWLAYDESRESHRQVPVKRKHIEAAVEHVGVDMKKRESELEKFVRSLAELPNLERAVYRSGLEEFTRRSPGDAFASLLKRLSPSPASEVTG
jgi:hypothetical protein